MFTNNRSCVIINLEVNMNILEIWNHPELFENYDFSHIDDEVQFIQNKRNEFEIFNKTIKELNNRIDIDFIKDSELIEGNQIFELKDISFDEEFEELYETNIFNKKVKNSKIDDFFLGEYRTFLKNGRLTIYRKDPLTNNIYKFNCSIPKHLSTLKYALDLARKENALIEQGNKVDISTKFIENMHEKMFEDYIQINLRLSKTRSEVIRPEGYGQFRRTIQVNGQEHKYNVAVEGTKWSATDSDDVKNEMETLIENYNNSTLHPILKAILFKVCLIKIHPFRDGNGRLSRILLNYMLVRNGLPTVTIRGTHKDEYFEALDTAIETQDFSKIIELLINNLNQRLNQYLTLYHKLDLNNIESLSL